jgi:hypothetical protein
VWDLELSGRQAPQLWGQMAARFIARTPRSLAGARQRAAASPVPVGNVQRRRRVPSGALHWGTDWAHHAYYWQGQTYPAGTDISQWHEYAAEWTANAVILSVDGRVFLTMDTQPTGYFNQPFYLLLNLAVGGNYDAPTQPPANMTPQQMQVDYVRVYQRQ